MNNQIFKDIFSLNTSYQNWILEDTTKGFSDLKMLAENFNALFELKINKLPYRLNLLDDLSTNENAHSKFLIWLLQHRPALINFIQFLNKSTPISFDIGLIKTPQLTYEKMRIDGLIQENGRYSIIIENKIHGAAEQKQQIGNYIDKCRARGYKTEQIFVVYLTKNAHDNPSVQIWGKKYKQDDFQTRYCKLSYQSEIIPWLETYRKNIPSKEHLVRSAVTQYLDHLKHLFNKSDIYTKMNTELQKFLSQELRLGSDPIENTEIVTKKINEINQLQKQLQELAKNSIYQLFNEWSSNIDKNYNFEADSKFLEMDSNFIKTGIILEWRGFQFSVLIEYDFKTVYFGIGRHFASEFKHPEINELLMPLTTNESLKPNTWWYGWKNTSFKDAYFDFENLLKLVMQTTAKHPEI